jgi:hypothetical protein
MIDALVQEILEWVKATKPEAIGMRQWFQVSDGDKYINIYVRQGFRYLDTNNINKTLELATVEVSPMKEGIFTSFLDQMEKVNPFSYLYIENALPYLADSLIKRGWSKAELNKEESNYFLYTKQEVTDGAVWELYV